MKTISIPTNNRPETLRCLLESLRAAIGIDQWALVFSCEPDQQVFDMISRMAWKRIYFTRNLTKFGCWENTFRAANFAMALGSDVNLYLEDDVLVSSDVLTLVDQWLETDYPILALRRPEPFLKPEPSVVSNYVGGLFGDGFAWRRSDWPLVRSAWFAPGYSMWDWAVEGELRKQHVLQARPHQNRSQNIGLTGTHQTGFDSHRHSPCYQGPPVQKFTFL